MLCRYMGTDIRRTENGYVLTFYYDQGRRDGNVLDDIERQFVGRSIPVVCKLLKEHGQDIEIDMEEVNAN